MTDLADDVVSAREAARERALQLRDEQKKMDRRRRLMGAGIVVGSVLVIVAVVTALALSQGTRTQRGPANMLSDGIKMGVGEAAERTVGLAPGATPRAFAANDPSVTDIRIYVDYLCERCGAFQRSNGAQLTGWLTSGAATVEVHPVALLTTNSAGTQYSLRAANAAACVAQYSPDTFYRFHTSLLSDQPKEGTAGLSDEQLIDRAKDAGVRSLSTIGECIHGQRFKSWVQAATSRALAGPLPNTELDAIPGPLTVVVNGSAYSYTSKSTAVEFAQFVQLAAGQTFAKKSSSTPSPSPSATPAP
ncbi:MAG TPA: thioredoxin domain-containing protein [Pseudolysinimonas sp.]|nr:thioredoxin domain-containing protein [Pseudolysinimonas sp.]